MNNSNQTVLRLKVVEVVDRANRNNFVTVLRYNVNKADSPYAQVRLLARKKKDEKFQQVVYVKYKLEEFIYLIDVMNYVYKKVITNQLFCIVSIKVISLVYSLPLFFFSSQDELEHWR